jgi:hypothetical protein
MELLISAGLYHAVARHWAPDDGVLTEARASVKIPTPSTPDSVAARLEFFLKVPIEHLKRP